MNTPEKSAQLVAKYKAQRDEVLKALKLCITQLDILVPELGRVGHEKAALDAGKIAIKNVEQSL